LGVDRARGSAVTRGDLSGTTLAYFGPLVVGAGAASAGWAASVDGAVSTGGAASACGCVSIDGAVSAGGAAMAGSAFPAGAASVGDASLTGAVGAVLSVAASALDDSVLEDVDVCSATGALPVVARLSGLCAVCHAVMATTAANVVAAMIRSPELKLGSTSIPLLLIRA
jgi:hypothetical protein